MDAYRAEGYLDAVYLGSAVALDSRLRTAQVTLRLREGARTRVERVEFSGQETLDEAALAKLIRLEASDPLAYPQVEEARLALLRAYVASGHAWARVEVTEDLDRARHTGVVRFQIREGPQARISRVLITGNRRTRPEVVREALTLQAGSVWIWRPRPRARPPCSRWACSAR
ncbi:MAG: POTRA domain-containing protein [Anaeromyxobacter sp.]